MNHPTLTPSRNVCERKQGETFSYLTLPPAPTPTAPPRLLKAESVFVSLLDTRSRTGGDVSLSLCDRDTYGVLGITGAELLLNPAPLHVPEMGISVGSRCLAEHPSPAVPLFLAELSALMASPCRNRKCSSVRAWTWSAIRSSVS